MPVTETPFPFADVELARRLERAEGHSNASFVDARARLLPGCGACRIEVAGAQAMFDGPSSPMTQTFGLGMFQAVTAGDFAELEAFFEQRGAPVFHEVSPLADPSTPALLNERGYHPLEFTSVLYRPITRDAGLKPCATNDGNVTDDREVAQGDWSVAQGFSPANVRLIRPGEEELFGETAAAGWREFGAGDLLREISRVNAAIPSLRLFFAELDGMPIATAALHISGGVAHFAGASTIPEGRKRGAQLALLDYRLQYAAERGCDVALMGALPGSGSQRNAERNGFRIAYTRIKWKL